MWRNNSQLERQITKSVLNSMCLLVCIFGLAGNGAVVFFLGFRIKKNKFTIYILNLALADFIFLLFTSFVMTLDQHHDQDIILKILLPVLLLSLFGYNASLYLLTAISMERCLSVLYPIWYQCRRPKHQSAVVCSLLWLLSCLMTAGEIFICDKREYFSVGEDFPIHNKWCNAIYFSIGFLNFFVFTPLMVLSSVTLLIKVKRNSWKRQPSKLYVVIVATVILFLIFALPIRVMLQVEYKYRILLPMIFVDMSSLLCSINSSVNPFVYWFVGHQGGGKTSFQMILHRIFREDMKEDTHQHLQEIPDSSVVDTKVPKVEDSM
ncbi:proto-oncogene Mas-like [Pleurodeles waltl]|uniref:proto-oncogene Mas-like n=1 Tax=Pleurodeles waltl TaxID=8319 RepID=UPI003709B0D7